MATDQCTLQRSKPKLYWDLSSPGDRLLRGNFRLEEMAVNQGGNRRIEPGISRRHRAHSVSSILPMRSDNVYDQINALGVSPYLDYAWMRRE